MKRVSGLIVEAWNGLGEHVLKGVSKGQEMVIVGRLAINKFNRASKWTKGCGLQIKPGACLVPAVWFQDQETSSKQVQQKHKRQVKLTMKKRMTRLENPHEVQVAKTRGSGSSHRSSGLLFVESIFKNHKTSSQTNRDDFRGC